MNPKALVPLILGLGIAGFAAKLGFDHLRNAQGAPTKTVQLWTPVTDIPRGAAITEAMVQPLPFPVDVAPKNAIANRDKLVGRVPHTGAPAGVPILDSMLLPPGSSPGIHVPPGLRAVAVKIDESSGVDNHLQPGCKVDVVGYFNTRRGDKAEIIARTLIEDCEVAAVGARLAPEAPKGPEAADAKSKSTRAERPARAVTLLVKPDQVPTLHLAEQRGKIKLSMRSYEGAPGDDTGLAEATESQVLGEVEEPTESGGEFGSLVSSLFDSWMSKPAEPTPVVAVEPPPAPEPQAPALAWTMVIYNGTDRHVLGWQTLQSIQAMEIVQDGPNVFQQPPVVRKTPIDIPTPTEPEPSDATGSDDAETHEPEELFE